VEDELETPTLHFDIPEPTQVLSSEQPSAEEETEEDEDFEFAWYSDEELDSLRKEFGLLPDGTKVPQSPPSWDNSRPVRVIKTKLQKEDQTSKGKGKSTKSSKKS
jgi:hypothetical protein